MLVSTLKPTPDNTLAWNPDMDQKDFTAFINKINYEEPGFVSGLHPVVDGDIRQEPKHLARFFQQLRVAMVELSDLDDICGEIYFMSEKARKPVTEEMVRHLDFEDGVWDPECPRVEGWVEFVGAEDEIDYRDMAFIFSNFGDQFETSLDELLQEGDLPFIPDGLRKRKFRSTEFLIQVISKCVNSLSFPARLTKPEDPEETERNFEAFANDCIELGFPLVPIRTGIQQDERALVRGFNELLMQKACLADSDREVKQYGQRFRLDTEAYFALTRGIPMPMECRGNREVQFGLNDKMQAAGFLIRALLDPKFADLLGDMIELGVLVGEAATYNRGGRLMPDLNWGGDFGFQFAPHQQYYIDGKVPVYYDAMRVGFCAAAAALVGNEADYPYEGYQQYREMLGHPGNTREAIRNLLKAVLLDPLAPQA
jgi:hypothetical protein